MTGTRYSVRPGSVALTVQAWCIVALAVVVGLVGLGLVLADPGLGELLMSISGVTTGLVIVTAGPGAEGG